MLLMECLESKESIHWACGGDPFRCYHTVAMLSGELWMATSRTPDCCARVLCWATLVASSRSLLVTVPPGFEKVMSWSLTCLLNGVLHNVSWTSPLGHDTHMAPLTTFLLTMGGGDQAVAMALETALVRTFCKKGVLPTNLGTWLELHTC
jgi:hypothetical protein